jgi:hypothetical protein
MPASDRLFELLPAWYRQLDSQQLRDGNAAGPLQGLLSLLSGQVELIESDIDGLYANWFIETCDDWVVPYIADLVGYDMVPQAGRPAAGAGARAMLKNRHLVPRREVAHTIRYRRRKGSLAVLEQLARDVAGWPARAVEFGTLVGVFQHVGHVRPKRGRTVDVRDVAPLELLGSPFDRAARTIDVRSLNAPVAPGRHNLASVALFVTRLRAYPVTGSPAHSIDPDGTFTVSPLGNDMQLFVRPCAEDDPTHIADPHNLPMPLTRLALETFDREGRPRASSDYYGVGKSVVLYEDGQPIAAERIVPANLDGWRYRPRGHSVALDPERGRIAFSSGRRPRSLHVDYHYGFPADIGGGEYARRVGRAGPDTYFATISATGETHNEIQAAVRAWHASGREHGVLEIADSRMYSESRLHIRIARGHTLELRAKPGARPVIRIVDYEGSARDAIVVEGEPTSGDQGGGRLVLDGLLIAGGAVEVRGAIGRVTLRDCLLVPGWDLKVDASAPHRTEPSLRFVASAPRVTIVRSIVGAIAIEPPEERSEPLRLSIEDSLVDALADDRDAVADADALFAQVSLTVRRSTVFGRVRVHAMPLGENSIFSGLVQVAKRQGGCLRFCYAPPGSRTPSRFNCQPDLAIENFRREMPAGDVPADVEHRVRPLFAGRRYGSRYGQLALDCAVEIRRGADDEAEMGVYHDLFEPQRAALLEARLQEYVPVGYQAAIIFVD